ncbi:hypothetical protein F2Q70_00027921 [Brassica cretica]|uniref:Uncharacterized protein n=1 Tax=Brassica cretica TaxID=69181 RepID=A0A8S9LGC9_BRACR|nr:hypothetical protein F2Q70_00027921 [Brassica cretica]
MKRDLPGPARERLEGVAARSRSRVVFSHRVSTKGRATRRCRSEDVALIDRIASDLRWSLRDVAPRATLELRTPKMRATWTSRSQLERPRGYSRVKPRDLTLEPTDRAVAPPNSGQALLFLGPCGMVKSILYTDDDMPRENPVASKVSAGDKKTDVELPYGESDELEVNTNAKHQPSSTVVPGGGRPASTKQVVGPNENGKKKARLA